MIARMRYVTITDKPSDLTIFYTQVIILHFSRPFLNWVVCRYFQDYVVFTSLSAEFGSINRWEQVHFDHIKVNRARSQH